MQTDTAFHESPFRVVFFVAGQKVDHWLINNVAAIVPKPGESWTVRVTNNDENKRDVDTVLSVDGEVVFSIILRHRQSYEFLGYPESSTQHQSRFRSFQFAKSESKHKDKDKPAVVDAKIGLVQLEFFEFVRADDQDDDRKVTVPLSSHQLGTGGKKSLKEDVMTSKGDFMLSGSFTGVSGDRGKRLDLQHFRYNVMGLGDAKPEDVQAPGGPDLTKVYDL